MSYTLNTSHPLYGNIIELIGVQSGALVSHKTARTFTKHTEASYGTGTHGEHFRTVGGGLTAKGASISPSVAINTTTTPNVTLLAVVNQISAAGGGATRAIVSSTHGSAFSMGLTTTGFVTALSTYNVAISTSSIDADVTASPHVLAVVRQGETAHKLYIDGSFNIDAPATKLAFNSSGTFWDYIGGLPGQASVAQDLVWLVWFDKLLSEAELDDLSASLGASNAFGLVSTALPDATATGGAGTSTGSGTGGDATGGAGGSATATGGTGTSTGSGSGGDATGGTSGSFTSEVMVNNTGSVQASVSVLWEWRQGVGIGVAPTSVTYGSGTTSGAGILTVTGLPTGAGELLVALTDRSAVYYQAGTVT